MKRALIFTFLIAVVLIVVIYLYKNSETEASQAVNVYSPRKDELVRNLFDEFTKKMCIKVRCIIDDYSRLLSRIESSGEADLSLTADAVNSILARKGDFLS